MADRKTQLRTAAARARDNKRARGLKPHEIWTTDAEYVEQVLPLLKALERARQSA